jgi:ethanolamine utilization protein EutA
VCATAGPRLEALMAAHGSGAVALSRDRGSVLHVDIGGGTTKLSRIETGRVVDATAVNVGARLLAYDAAGCLTRRERAGAAFLQGLGAHIEIGDELPDALRVALAERMAAAVFDALEGSAEPWEGFNVIPPLAPAVRCDSVLFSGGVSEYIYGREGQRFGDLGPYLGHAMRAEAERRGYAMLDAGEGIRATVIGASAYSMQLSGETIFIPEPDQLPMHNLRTCVARVTWEAPIAERSEGAIREALDRRDAEELGAPFALVLASPPFYGYGAAQDLAEGIRHALRSAPPDEQPALLVFSENVGQSIGAALATELSVPCIDEITLSELDFVDVGRLVPGESYVPVVVKSLAFGF